MGRFIHILLLLIEFFIVLICGPLSRARLLFLLLGYEYHNFFFFVFKIMVAKAITTWPMNILSSSGEYSNSGFTSLLECSFRIIIFPLAEIIVLSVFICCSLSLLLFVFCWIWSLQMQSMIFAFLLILWKTN